MSHQNSPVTRMCALLLPIILYTCRTPTLSLAQFQESNPNIPVSRLRPRNPHVITTRLFPCNPFAFSSLSFKLSPAAASPHSLLTDPCTFYIHFIRIPWYTQYDPRAHKGHTKCVNSLIPWVGQPYIIHNFLSFPDLIPPNADFLFLPDFLSLPFSRLLYHYQYWISDFLIFSRFCIINHHIQLFPFPCYQFHSPYYSTFPVSIFNPGAWAMPSFQQHSFIPVHTISN